MSIAIITGASSGIGAEFSRQYAGRVDELWLVARRREKMVELGLVNDNKLLKEKVRQLLFTKKYGRKRIVCDLSQKGFDKQVSPSTLEGCVVRVSDIIAYLGKDFEDAVTLNLVTPEDIPFKVSRVLGATNREIIGTLCNDIIANSYDKGYLSFSDEVFEAFKAMKTFNYDRIYVVIY